jgi:hypothetical protein
MRRYTVNVETPIDEVLDLAGRYIAVRRALVEALSSSSRLTREYSSQALCDIAHSNAELIEEFKDDFIDALHRPEAPTRYNSLEIIRCLSLKDMRLIDRAWDGVEECLYDEDSGTVRLEAFRLLTTYGETTPARSKKAWPLISDALRCYHGDPEFMTMLNEFITMLKGNVSEEVRQEACNQFQFNADNATGLFKRKAQEIVSFICG